MNIAFFDFDGTITTKDTLIDFILYAVGKRRFVFTMMYLSPILLLYFCKIIPNWYAKQIVITSFFKGFDVEKFNALSRHYSLNRIPQIVKPSMMQKINTHKANGDTVVVVTASCENWVKPWCDSVGIECIATRLKVHNNILTGKFDGKNCYGVEKVKRIKEKYNLFDYDKIYAYGNSKGDRAMLALANISLSH